MAMRERSEAGRMAENDAAGCVGAVASRVGRAEEGDDRDFQRGCEMHRSGIAANEQSRTAGESNQFGDRYGKRDGGATRGRFSGFREGLLAGAEVDDGKQAVGSDGFGN